MWIFKLSDGTEFKGDRRQIARELNFFEDVYDDEVWDKFCSYYTVEYVDEPLEDIQETIKYLQEHNLLNRDDEDDMPF